MRLLSEATSAKKDEVVVGQTVGSYRIVGELGRGGMGVVYEAVHESIGQRAAVKVLCWEVGSQPQFGTSLLDEARAISMVRHPGLVNIFDFNRLPGGMVYIMMEYLEGDSLWQRYARLKKEGSWLTLPQVLQLARQIASTLAAVHRKSIVHRDLKPENIMLVDDPDMPFGERTKLLDFGIAKLRTSRPLKQESESGVILGTPAYMSPEQFLEEELDGQSDVYSLGAMIYEMVARKPPFEGRKWGELALKHLQEQPVPLRELVDVPEALDVLVSEMLAKDLHQRPVMAQVVDRLDELAEFLRTGNRAVGNATEIFSKVDPDDLDDKPASHAPADELGSPLLRPVAARVSERISLRPAAVVVPALDVAPSSEARTIRRVTLALAAATAVFLLGVSLFGDRHQPTMAHAASAPPAVVTSRAPMPVVTPMPMPVTTPMPMPTDARPDRPWRNNTSRARFDTPRARGAE